MFALSPGHAAQLASPHTSHLLISAHQCARLVTAEVAAALVPRGRGPGQTMPATREAVARHAGRASQRLSPAQQQLACAQVSAHCGIRRHGCTVT